MANTSGISWGVDLYRAVVFPLDTDGSLLATDTTVYEGLQFEGSRSWKITPAESRSVENYGDGRLRDTIYMAPNAADKGELLVGYEHQEVIAALTNVNKTAVGESSIVHMGTDQQGNEPMVALLLAQLAHDVNKNKIWRYNMVPRANVGKPKTADFDENATANTFPFSMSPSTKEIWGHTLSIADEKCTESAYAIGTSEGRPNIVAWVGDGNEDEFLLPVAKPSIATAKIAIFNWATGVEYTAGITKSLTGVVFDYPPSGLLCCKYEY